MAFNIWERWPWTSFQNLNLNWLMIALKQAVTTAEEASTTAEAIDGKATEALATANEASATAAAINGKATEALAAANEAQSVAANIKTTVLLAVYADGHVTHDGINVTGEQIHNMFEAGNYPYCVYIDNEGLHYVYKPATYAYIQSLNLYTQSFDCITPESAAGGDYELLKRLVIINGTAQFSNDIQLASTAYVDEHGVSNAVLYTVQTLTSAQKRQARSNIGAGKSTVTVSNSVMTIVDADTGSQTAYPIGGSGSSDSGGSYSPYLIPVTQSGGVYSTTATGEDVLDHILDCRIVFNGVNYYPIGATTSGPSGHAYFASIDPSKSGQYDIEIFDIELNGTSACTVTRYEKDVIYNGAQPYLPINASAATIPPLPVNTLVEFVGEAAALNITLAQPANNSISNEYHFIFTSGSTPTTLTIPNTIRQPDGFTVEANHVYEVSILNNNMTAQGWEVTP